MHRDQVEINTVDCPRCGCFLKKKFLCNCGQVHSDYCGNCGRFTSLSRTEHVEPCLFDQPCNAGPVHHDHQRMSVDEMRRRVEDEMRRSGS